MKIVILGFDGYYGYPLFKRLEKNHDVFGIDNFWRRELINSPSLIYRDKPDGIDCDVTDYDSLYYHLQTIKPDIVIHLAEQRSAPYSMKNTSTKHHTIVNNTTGTLNVLECAKLLTFKVIHIGSMGVYGYNKCDVIEEGDSVRGPGSVYHLTKCFDNSMFEMYSRLYGVNIVELHQGIIWGIGGRFDYDETFGTVLNRFIVQSLLDIPLTLYGNGNQLRPFIHIDNSLDCVELVINTETNGMETYNQYTEIKRLNELIDNKSKCIPNPRIENEDNILMSKNEKLLRLGLDPIYIDEKEITKIAQVIKPHLHNVREDLIWPKTVW